MAAVDEYVVTDREVARVSRGDVTVLADDVDEVVGGEAHDVSARGRHAQGGGVGSVEETAEAAPSDVFGLSRHHADLLTTAQVT